MVKVGVGVEIYWSLAYLPPRSQPVLLLKLFPPDQVPGVLAGLHRPSEASTGFVGGTAFLSLP